MTIARDDVYHGMMDSRLNFRTGVPVAHWIVSGMVLGTGCTLWVFLSCLGRYR